MKQDTYFEDKGFEILYTFGVSYIGWESDTTGWIVKKEDGTKYVVLTSHGGYYIGSILELKDRIQEYQQLLDGTQKALDMLKE